MKPYQIVVGLALLLALIVTTNVIAQQIDLGNNLTMERSSNTIELYDVHASDGTPHWRVEAHKDGEGVHEKIVIRRLSDGLGWAYDAKKTTPEDLHLHANMLEAVMNPPAPEGE